MSVVSSIAPRVQTVDTDTCGIYSFDMPSAPPDPSVKFTWLPDEYGCLNLRFIAEVEHFDGTVGPSKIHAWITPRPPYCDRGHWQFNVDGIPSIDHADSFPRYYMDLEGGKWEAEAWLRWRLWKQWV